MNTYGWFTIGMLVGVVLATIFIVVLEILYQTFSDQITVWLKKWEET